MKFLVGLFIGLGVASSAAQYPVVIDKWSGLAPFKMDANGKLLAALDSVEIAKIKEACK